MVAATLGGGDLGVATSAAAGRDQALDFGVKCLCVWIGYRLWLTACQSVIMLGVLVPAVFLLILGVHFAGYTTTTSDGVNRILLFVVLGIMGFM